MSENTSIADSLDKDGVMVEPMMPVQDGVPAPDQKPVQQTAEGTPGMAAQGTSDAGAWETKVAEVEHKYQRDMDRLRSSLQKNSAQERQEYEQRMAQMEQELHATRTSTMNEQERVAYERDVYAQRAEMLEKKYQDAESRLYEVQNMEQAKLAFQKMGIQPNKLDTTSMENLLQSGWVGVAERMAELESRTAAPRLSPNQPAPQQPPTPGPVQPPSTASVQGTPTGGRTWGDAYKSASSILGTTIDNEEDLMRAVEMCHLPPSILPGLG
jgi:hypothetical protein